MYISNNCILPKEWMTETLMKPHKSVPFNPSIANVFYRAGYIEAWGRGIQKICESCKELGAPEPEYTVLGNDLTVKFTAFYDSKGSTSKEPNRQDVGLDVGLEKSVLKMIASDPAITMKEMADNLNVTKRTIERVVKHLRERGTLVRKGGKRYGYWEITENR